MDEASKLLVKIVNDDDFVSQKGKSKHELWKQLCEIISKHPTKIAKDIKVEAIIRGGLQKFTDEVSSQDNIFPPSRNSSSDWFRLSAYFKQVGILWNALAEYYIRMSNFEKVSFPLLLHDQSYLVAVFQSMLSLITALKARNIFEKL